MMLTLLVSAAVRGTFVLAVGLVACASLFRASAATRRAVLVVALGASLVVPVVAAVGPSWRFHAPEALTVFAHESAREGAAVPGRAPATVGVESVAAPAPSIASRIDASSAVVALWVGGIVVLFARAVGSLGRARALVRKSVRVSSDHWSDVIAGAAREAGAVADVRLSDAVESPAVTGVLRSTVLVPTDADGWSKERKRVVLVHELAHVKRRDGLAQVLADVACAVSWFNPLAWLCARRLRVERELAADDAVLASGVRPSAYAEELLALAGGEARGALAMAERTSIGNRVVAILAAGRARSTLAARGTTLLAVASVAVGAVAACTSPEAASHGPSSAPLPATGASIDPRMQAAAEQELATLVKDAAAESATVLVLDSATGEILANAGERDGKPFDVARSQAMSPGSTLKAVTLAVAIETNAITSGQMFECGPKPRVYTVGEVHDAHENGTLDAAHMLAVSSNIGFSHVFDAIGGERFGTWLGRFHFGQALALDGAASGSVPATITTGTAKGAMVATGGNGVTATPLQIAAAYAALANDGVYHAPTLDKSVSPAERLVSEATARQVVAMLSVVVMDDGGTGTLARVEGVHIAGKTGTAAWTAPDGHDDTYASFVGIADVGGRRLVALVGVETRKEDASGGSLAAPVFSRLVTRLR
jgi:beta-lactamase regulating signal transducer with metallopeptidase domain